MKPDLNIIKNLLLPQCWPPPQVLGSPAPSQILPEMEDKHEFIIKNKTKGKCIIVMLLW